MRRWIVWGVALAVAGCSETGGFSVTDPGAGDTPSGSITRLSVGSRYGGYGPVIRVSAGFERGRVRVVTPDEVFLFEETDEGLLWRGGARMGEFDAALVLVPANVRDGMRWQTGDGTFSWGASAASIGEGVWNIGLERTSGIYADPDHEYRARFSFREGVGLIESTVTETVGLTPLDGPLVPRYVATVAGYRTRDWVAVEGFDPPEPLDAPSLTLTSEDFPDVPGCADRIVASTDGAVTRLYVHGQERYWQAPGVGASIWGYASRPISFCSEHDAGTFTPCGGDAPGTFSELGERRVGLDRWPAAFLLGAFDRDPPLATAADPERGVFAIQGAGRVWGAGAYDFDSELPGAYRWDFDLGFARAGQAQRHTTDARTEVLIAHADGAVFRARITEDGVQQELLGVVDLPDGELLGGVARLGEPNGDAEDTELVVTTCTRASPFPFHDADPGRTRLWTTTLPAATAVPARDADVVIAEATVGVVACGLGSQAPTGIEVDGETLELEAAAHVGECGVGLRSRAPTDGFGPSARVASDATISFGAARVRIHNDQPVDGVPLIMGPDTPAFVSDDGALSVSGSFDANGVPNGPGAAEQLGVSEDAVLLDTVTGRFAERGVTGMANEFDGNAAGGGFFGWEGGQVRWTDGESEEWTADLPGSGERVFVWADGRVCTFGLRTLVCRGADGEERSRALDVLGGGSEASRQQFGTRDGWIVLESTGALTIDPDSATVTSLGDNRAFRDSVGLTGRTPEALYYVSQDRRLLKVTLDGTAELRWPATESYQVGFVRPIRPGLLAGPLFAGVLEDNLDEVIYFFEEEELGPPTRPPPLTYEPGDVGGEFVVGDVGLPVTPRLTRGTTPDLLAQGSFTVPVGPVLPRFGAPGHVRVTESGLIALNPDGTDGALTPFTSTEAPFEVLSPPLSSPDGRYLAMHAQGGTFTDPPALMRLDRMTGTEAILGTGVGGGGYGGIGIDGSMLYFANNPTSTVPLRLRDPDGAVTDLTIPSIPIDLAAPPGAEWFAWTDGSDAHLLRADGESIGDITGAQSIAIDPTGHFLVTHGSDGLVVYALGAGPLPAALARITPTPLATGSRLAWSPAGDALITERLGEAQVVRVGSSGVSVGATFSVPANARFFFSADASTLTATGTAAPVEVRTFGPPE